jgi:hypothetical protein
VRRARRIDEGWTVVVTTGASGDAAVSPRWRLTVVAPRQTITRGRTAAISASSHGRQAAISREVGFWWMRRFSRTTHLKCLTTFVT